MRFQHSWKDDDPIPEESQNTVDACVRRAFELGIHHFETARGYGTSEEQLGRVLPELPRDKILVQTKVGPNKDVSKFVADFEKSMNLLQVGYLDLFSFHGINNEETLEAAMVCLDQAQAWKKEGRIRHIGFSTHGPTDIIVKAVQSGVFEHVNLHWYYIFQDNWPAIEEARKLDMGVMVISPNDKAGLLYKPSMKLEGLTAPLHPMIFNALFCLARPEVHTLSCGVARPEELNLHVAAADNADMAAEMVRPIEQRLEREMARVLGKEWVDTWHVGLPEWHETPGDINIPWILRLRNLALAFDMVEFGKMRYNLLGSGGHWFPGNKADQLDKVRDGRGSDSDAGEVSADDLAECLKNSPHASLIPALLAETHELLAGEERKRLQKE